MDQALYRRYRPETFVQMIGQKQVTEPLSRALDSGRIGHAYLFSGPRGTGKTTSARIMARCLNCRQGPASVPCGSCPSCVELGLGGPGSLDVVEIDAASHNGVDDARDLRDRTLYAPSRDRFKIFILDEAHMVTPQGFNALLKTVEEPPEHIKFIFATTEPEKVISTIRSRTLHYPFRLIAPEVMRSFLAGVCEKENIAASREVLDLVVRAGGGSVRDTLSILDQLIAGSVEEIELTEASRLLGFVSDDLLDSIVLALAEGSGSLAYATLDRVVETGAEPARFAEELLARFRDLLVAKVSGAMAAKVLSVRPERLDCLIEQAEKFSLGDLDALAQTVLAGLDRLGGATSPRLVLELLLASLLLVRRPEKAPSSPPAVTPPLVPDLIGKPKVGLPPMASAPRAPSKPRLGLREVLQAWPRLLAEIDPRAKSILEDSRPARLRDEVLTLEFSAEKAKAFRADRDLHMQVRTKLLELLGISFKFLVQILSEPEPQNPPPDRRGEAAIREMGAKFLREEETG